MKAFPFLPEKLLTENQSSTNSEFIADDEPEKDGFNNSPEINSRRIQLKESISKLSIPAIKRNMIIHLIIFIVIGIGFFLFCLLYIYFYGQSFLLPLRVTCQLSELGILDAFIYTLPIQYLYQKVGYFSEMSPFFTGQLQSMGNQPANQVLDLLNYSLLRINTLIQEVSNFRHFQSSDSYIESIQELILANSFNLRLYQKSHKLFRHFNIASRCIFRLYCSVDAISEKYK